MKWIKISFLLTSTTLLSNCSDVSFKDQSSASSSTDDGSFAAEINQPGSSTTSNSTNDSSSSTSTSEVSTPQIVPKVQFISPACQRQSLCEAEFRLDKAYSLTTEFDWRTNDTLYLTPHSPSYAQPYVHYSPTTGHLVFLPGETSKKIYIQNINSNGNAVIIGVIMSACRYGTYTGSCTSFFN